MKLSFPRANEGQVDFDQSEAEILANVDAGQETILVRKTQSQSPDGSKTRLHAST